MERNHKESGKKSEISKDKAFRNLKEGIKEKPVELYHGFNHGIATLNNAHANQAYNTYQKVSMAERRRKKILDEREEKKRLQQMNNITENNQTRGISPFMFFGVEQGPILRRMHPQLRISQIRMKIAENWYAMSDDDKQKYRDKANARARAELQVRMNAMAEESQSSVGNELPQKRPVIESINGVEFCDLDKSEGEMDNNQEEGTSGPFTLIEEVKPKAWDQDLEPNTPDWEATKRRVIQHTRPAERAQRENFLK